MNSLQILLIAILKLRYGKAGSFYKNEALDLIKIDDITPEFGSENSTLLSMQVIVLCMRVHESLITSF